MCGVATEYGGALSGAARLAPDLILVDLEFSGSRGFKLIGELIRNRPGASILALSADGRPESANRALRAGAQGYILKPESPEEIIQAILDTLAGEIYVSEAILEAPAIWRKKRLRREFVALRSGNRSNRVFQPLLGQRPIKAAGGGDRIREGSLRKSPCEAAPELRTDKD